MVLRIMIFLAFDKFSTWN